MFKGIIGFLLFAVIVCIIAGCGGQTPVNQTYTGHWTGIWNAVWSDSVIGTAYSTGTVDMRVDPANNVTGTFASSNTPWLSTPLTIQPPSTIAPAQGPASINWTAALNGTTANFSGFVIVNQNQLQTDTTIQLTYIQPTYTTNYYFSFALTQAP
jgi:hypothetical protein